MLRFDRFEQSRPIIVTKRRIYKDEELTYCYGDTKLEWRQVNQVQVSVLPLLSGLQDYEIKSFFFEKADTIFFDVSYLRKLTLQTIVISFHSIILWNNSTEIFKKKPA